MKKIIKHTFRPYLFLIPLSLVACQEKADRNKGLAGTHPELARELAKDSLTVPYNDSTNRRLYDRYRITTEQYMKSGDYRVASMYRGRLAPLDESSHADARTYRSILRKGLKEGINFAGKYTVVSVGCGSGCQRHYVVDRESGKVLDKIESSMGARFSRDSRLFIINPPDTTVNYSACRQCTPQSFLFENGKFQKLEQQPE